MILLNAIRTVGARFIAPARGLGGGRDESRPYAFVCLSALGLTAFIAVAPAHAFEPMPPIMQTLLKVFPEENGRFVDEPFGSTPEMPEEAKPLFETFRVVVPTVEDIEKNLAILIAASPDLPIRKIVRYDKEPGAPGLPGFRGAWCQTEDDEDVGFSILTINQNRFLIWAKTGYYPAFDSAHINATVRDQYARDVGQWLIVSDSMYSRGSKPMASGRGLPEWMEFYRDPKYDSDDSMRVAYENEFHEWGMENTIGFIPTAALMDSIIAGASHSVSLNQGLAYIQDRFDGMAAVERVHNGPRVWAGETLLDVWFAIDRYGRMRYVGAPDECGGGYVDVTTLFPGAAILTVGALTNNIRGDNQDRNVWVMHVAPLHGRYFYDDTKISGVQELRDGIEAHVRSIGHLFALLQSSGINIDETLILRGSRWAW